MSYASIPRQRGYAGYNDQPGADPAKYAISALQSQDGSAADQSKADAIAFAQAQIANYPPASALADQYNQYKAYLTAISGFDAHAFLTDPKAAEAWMKEALVAYAAANGIPTNTAQAKAYIASIASGALGVPIPSDWPTTTKDLKKVAYDFAATACVMYTGVDPKIISVTAEALMDGKLTPDECEAIGGTAGAIAGAAIGQAVGIPAPIGAFIGNLVGRDIGGTLGQIFGAGPSGTEEMEARIAAMKSWETATVQQANRLCTDARKTYWDTFDQLILATEVQWQAAEAKIGWKFDLRWFGIESYSKFGQSFSHAWDSTNRRFDGPLITSNRAALFKKESTCVLASGSNKCIPGVEYTYFCSYAYGCPYPPLPPGLNGPTGFARDVSAYLARGALWLPPIARQVGCSYPLPSALDLMDSQTKDKWLHAMCSDLQQEQAALEALKILSVTVIGDLVKTAASVAAEKAMHDQLMQSRNQLNRNALARGQALAAAKSTGKNLSDLLNYGVLALGAGLLGVALYRREKS